MPAYITLNCTGGTGDCTWTYSIYQDNGGITTCGDTSMTYTTGTTTTNSVVYYPIWENVHDWDLNCNQQYQPETAEQRQAREAREAEERARWTLKEQEDKKARESATEKGNKLLKDVLGDEAYELFKQQGYVDVQSRKDVNKRYRIRSQRRIGIVKFENGQWVEKALSLCIHPPNSWNWVEGDLLATHVLLAKFNEPDLERVANLHSMAA